MFQKSSIFLRHLIQVLFVTMGYLYVGYSLTYYAIIQYSMIYVMRFQDSSQLSEIVGFINALLPVGAACAALFSAPIANKLKYRVTFIYADIIGIFVALLFTYPQLTTFIIARGFQGFITGLNSALVIQYIYHLTQSKNVGFFMGLGPCMMMMGLTLGFLVQWIFIQSTPEEFSVNENYGYLGFNRWRLIFLFTSIPCTIRLIGLLLVFKNDLLIEQLIQGKEEIAQLQIQCSYPNSTDEEIYQFLTLIRQNLQEEKQSMIDLFNTRYLKSTLICISFSILQQFSGINAVNFYAGVIIGAITNNNQLVINIANVGNGLISLFASIFSSILINKYGRKKLLLIGNGICLIALNFKQNSYYQILSLILLFVYITSYSFSLGPIFWVYISEVMTAKGISLVSFVNWLSCAILTQAFPIVTSDLGLQYIFVFFAIICLMLWFLIYYCIFETKGMSKLEIQKKFRKKNELIESQ